MLTLSNDTVSLSYKAVVVHSVTSLLSVVPLITSFLTVVPFVDDSVLRAIINKMPDAIVARAAIMQNAKEK